MTNGPEIAPGRGEEGKEIELSPEDREFEETARAIYDQIKAIEAELPEEEKLRGLFLDVEVPDPDNPDRYLKEGRLYWVTALYEGVELEERWQKSGETGEYHLQRQFRLGREINRCSYLDYSGHLSWKKNEPVVTQGIYSRNPEWVTKQARVELKAMHKALVGRKVDVIIERPLK